MSNPIKASDLYVDDGAILSGIAQLEQMQAAYKNSLSEIKKEAAELIKSLKGVNTAQNEGQSAAQGAATQASRLEKAQKRYEQSLSDTEKEIVRYREALKKQNAINRLTERLNNSAEGSYDRLSAQYSLNKIRLNAMSEAQRKNTKTGQQLERQSREIYEEMNRLQKATGKNQLQVGRYDMVNQKLIGTLRNLAATYISLAAAQQAVNAVYTDTKEIDRLDKAYQMVIQDGQEIGETYDWLADKAEAYGVDVLTLQQTYLKFRVAARETNLSLDEQRNIYDSVIKSSAIMGNTTEETSGILRALEQILSKGKVQAEELRGQLGDRLPGAFQIMAKSMGISNAELDKMLEQGQVMAEDVLPNFAKELEKSFGADKVDRIENLTASEGRLRNAQVKLVEAFKASGPLISLNNNLASLLGWVRENLSAIKSFGQFLLLALSSIVAYRGGILLTTAAEKLRITSLIKMTRAQGLYNTAANLGRRATMALNTAIKRNPLGLVLSIITTVAGAWLIYKDNVEGAADAQGDLNDELAKTEEQLGKESFQEWLRQMGAENVPGFDIGIPERLGLPAFRKQLAQLNKNELRNYQAYFERFIGDADRAKNNYEQLSLAQKGTFEVDQAQADRYREFLAAVNKELDAYNRQKNETNKTDVEDFTEFDRRAEQIAVMQDGMEKELAQLKLEFDRKEQLWKKHGMDTSALLAFYNREKLGIEKKYQDEYFELLQEADEKRQDDLKNQYDRQLTAIDQRHELRLSEIDALKDTEAEKTRLRLEAEKERINKILELNKGAERQLSLLQIETLKNTLKAIDNEIAALGEDSGRRDIYQILGLKLNDDQKRAVQESVNFVRAQLQEIIAARVRQAEEVLQNAQSKVQSAEEYLRRELELQRQGYANNVNTARQQLQLARENEEKALQQKEEALKQQQRLDAIAQASSLITASANFWKAFSPLGPGGIALAIGAIGTMFASFLASKTKAQESIQTFGDGGYEVLQGGSHASGNDIPIGRNKKGRQMRAEGGEGMAIFNRRATKKYGPWLPELVRSINAQTFLENGLGAFNQQLPPEVFLSAGRDSTNMGVVEGELQRIRKQGEEKRYTRDGYEVIEKGDFKQIIRR